MKASSLDTKMNFIRPRSAHCCAASTSAVSSCTCMRGQHSQPEALCKSPRPLDERQIMQSPLYVAAELTVHAPARHLRYR